MRRSQNLRCPFLVPSRRLCSIWLKTYLLYFWVKNVYSLSTYFLNNPFLGRTSFSKAKWEWIQRRKYRVINIIATNGKLTIYLNLLQNRFCTNKLSINISLLAASMYFWSGSLVDQLSSQFHIFLVNQFFFFGRPKTNSPVHVVLVSLFGRPIVRSISHFFGRPIFFWSTKNQFLIFLVDQFFFWSTKNH